MRITPLALALGLAASTVSVPTLASEQAMKSDPRSAALLEKGKALRAAGKLVEADDALEAALVADPANRAAFVEMARVAIDQKLYGQAIAMTRKALVLEPTDRDALGVQGEAMIELGAMDRAKANRDKLAKLCPTGCDPLGRLDGKLRSGPSMAAAQTGEKPKAN
ncbi:tetratricopeptide repeat protein [Sphingomicrobium nitratireducens]|uniref:tetratricopeptide repeat protein n=1 Tax=Sphingomicrobium nitratireducens TaxID=2964666 RepID=UPI002240D776|nr:hypothetical protein [Sphingomicrobium nitratireducens]